MEKFKKDDKVKEAKGIDFGFHDKIGIIVEVSRNSYLVRFGKQIQEYQKGELILHKELTNAFRKPYYEFSDSTYSLENALKEKKDKDIQEVVKKIRDLENELHTILERKYLWD